MALIRSGGLADEIKEEKKKESVRVSVRCPMEETKWP